MSSAILKALCSSLSCVMARQSSDMSKLRSELTKARSVVILTGAGVSAESGIATFRGAGGLWRKYQAASLATPEAFYTSPSLVWEFYHYRREAARTAKPNAAHIAIANYEEKQNSMDKTVTVITQNVDGLHLRAGTKNLIELHGNLYKTRCTKCKEVLVNNESPLCESPLQRVTSQRDLGVLMDPKLTFHDHIAKVCRAAYRTLGFVMRQAYHLCSIEAIKALAGRGAPDENVVGSDVPVKSLPHCKKPGCSALLRPHIVWFGENLDTSILDQAHRAMEACDVCLVVGTSSVVYPAAMFAPEAAARGATVAEFNLEPTPSTRQFHYYFEGPCGTTLPQALDQLKMS